MNVQDKAKWEGIMNSILPQSELDKYGNLSPYNREEYVEGFKAYIDELNKVLDDKNNGNGGNGQSLSSEDYDDGLVHPVNQDPNQLSSNLQLQSQRLTENINKAKQLGKQAQLQKNASSALQAADAALQAASDALLAANQAQKAADATKQKADLSGKVVDRNIADAAQKHADKAQQAADAALQAADRAQQAADAALQASLNGNSAAEKQAAQEAGKAAQDAANTAEKAEQSAARAQSKDKDSQQSGQDAQSGQSCLSGQDGQQGDQSSQQGGQNGQQGGQNGLQGGQQGGQSDAGDGDDNYSGPSFDHTGMDTTNNNNEITVELDGDGTWKFDGQDLTLGRDSEWLKDVLERAGQTLDSDDMTNVADRNAGLFEKNKEKMKKHGKANSRGFGNSLASVAYDIEERFRPTVNWKGALKKLFNAVSEETSPEEARAIRRMGVNRNNPLYVGRYQYPDIKFNSHDNGIMQVFILVDNSGSMYQTTGNGSDVFDNILSEIIGLEKKCDIKRSAFSYFGDSTIKAHLVRTWEAKDMRSPEKILNMIKRRKGDNGGGTSVAHAIASLPALGKKLYSDSSSPKKRTVLIVVTDGADDYSLLPTLLSSTQLNSTIFLVTATDSELTSTKEVLTNKGIPSRNVLLVDIKKEW